MSTRPPSLGIKVSRSLLGNLVSYLQGQPLTLSTSIKKKKKDFFFHACIIETVELELQAVFSKTLQPPAETNVASQGEKAQPHFGKKTGRERGH